MDPDLFSNYASLTLTHVQYDPSDPLAKPLALATLAPFVVLSTYATLILYRRELTIINAFVGQVGCEVVNEVLKRLFKQQRPTNHLGPGYGMPSSHAQFFGFFFAFFILHYLHNQPTAEDGSVRRWEHRLAMLFVASSSAVVCYSRIYLTYHTIPQVLVGALIGVFIGGAYYFITEALPKRPLPLPSPLVKVLSPPRSPSPIAATETGRSDSPTRSTRSKTSRTKTPHGDNAFSDDSATGTRRRRRRSPSEKADDDVDGDPAPPATATVAARQIPLRTLILLHPIAQALRIKDSWDIWSDGGRNAEWLAWREAWEAKRGIQGTTTKAL